MNDSASTWFDWPSFAKRGRILLKRTHRPDASFTHAPSFHVPPMRSSFYARARLPYARFHSRTFGHGHVLRTWWTVARRIVPRVLLVHVVVTSQGRLGRDRLSVGVGLNPVRVPFHVSLNPVRGGFDWRSGREERGSGIDVGWTCRWQRPSKEGWPRQKRWTCKRSWTCRWTSW